MGEEEKKPEETKPEGEKKGEPPVAPAAEPQTPPPPPPPQEIVLKVYMHCEGCARKVRRSLKGFEGVEEVITDIRTSKVIVKGEKADPLKVLERVQHKSHRQVNLLSPIPPPQQESTPNNEQKEVVVKVEEKIQEPPMVTVVLGVYMHCEACAQEIKKRIMRMKGVETAEPDLKSSQVTVKGVLEPEKLVDYVYKRTGKHATIVKVEEAEKKAEEEKGKEEKKAEEGEKEAKNDEAGKENKEGGGGSEGGATPPANKVEEAELEDPKMELKKNELYYYYPQNYQVYPQRFVQDMYAYPPQIFSDENPNACSVM